ncbi:MAG: serine protease [Firmicutes bacterium]|nr:serine protease [Bacillota bacterium]
MQEVSPKNADKAEKQEKIVKITALALVVILFLTSIGFNIALVVMLRALSSKIDETPPLTATEIFNRRAASVCEITVAGEAGTGFLVDTRMGFLYIVTNYHVITRLTEGEGEGVPAKLAFYSDAADVYENNAEKTEITLAGYDIYHDIAVLRVTDKRPQKTREPLNEAEGVPARTAEDIVLLGNMQGGGIAAFNGIVSRDCTIVDFVDVAVFSAPRQRYKPVIQITADVNSGSSGGPIFNLNNQFIGFGMAQAVNLGQPVAGVSYAVPAVIAMPLIRKMVWGVMTGGGEIDKIEAFMSKLNGQNTLDLWGLDFSITPLDGGYTVNWVRGPQNTALTQGDWVEIGDKIVSIGGVQTDGLTISQIFGIIGAYRLEGRNEFGLLEIRFTRNGVSRTLRYHNIRRAF